MAIHGMNFNCTRIPPTYKYPERITVIGKVGVLAGVCDTKSELASMIAQASNGSRELHVVERDNSFAVYTLHTR